MDKRLYLEFVRDMCADLTDFRKRKLPGRNDAARSERMPEAVCPVIRVVRLRADMAGNLGTHLLCEHKHRRIRDNQRVRPDVTKLLKIASHSL